MNRSKGFGGGGGGWPGPVAGAVPGAGGVAGAGTLSAFVLFLFLKGFIFFNTSTGFGGGGGGPWGGCANIRLLQKLKPILAEITIKHFLILLIGCIMMSVLYRKLIRVFKNRLFLAKTQLLVH